MIHCFPFTRKPGACGWVVHYSLFIITIHNIRAPATLTTHAKAAIRQRDESGYTNECNLERMQAGNGKQLIILEWPKQGIKSCELGQDLSLTT